MLGASPLKQKCTFEFMLLEGICFRFPFVSVLLFIAVLSWLRISANWFWNKMKNSPNLSMLSLRDDVFYSCLESRAAVGSFSSAFPVSSWLDFWVHFKYVLFNHCVVLVVDLPLSLGTPRAEQRGMSVLQLPLLRGRQAAYTRLQWK